MREIQFGQDGSFSWESMVDRHNADLANGLGNREPDPGDAGVVLRRGRPRTGAEGVEDDLALIADVASVTTSTCRSSRSPALAAVWEVVGSTKLPRRAPAVERGEGRGPAR